MTLSLRVPHWRDPGVARKPGWPRPPRSASRWGRSRNPRAVRVVVPPWLQRKQSKWAHSTATICRRQGPARFTPGWEDVVASECQGAGQPAASSPGQGQPRARIPDKACTMPGRW